MGRTRPPYTPEFRAEAVRLARTSGRPLREIANDLSCSLESLRHWVKQMQIDAGEREGLATEERENENRLLREVKRYRRQIEEVAPVAGSDPRGVSRPGRVGRGGRTHHGHSVTVSSPTSGCTAISLSTRMRSVVCGS